MITTPLQQDLAHVDQVIASAQADLERYEQRRHESVVEFILTRIHSLQLNVMQYRADDCSNLVIMSRGAIMELLSVLDITATTLNVDVEEARVRMIAERGWEPDWTYNKEV